MLTYHELESAIEYATAGECYDVEVYLNKQTGQLHYEDESTGETLPEDVQEQDYYIQIPLTKDLDILPGRLLPLRFARNHLSVEAYEQVYTIFQSKGAFQRYRTYLETNNLLDQWYAFESDKYKHAIMAWCEEHNITLSE